MKLNVNTDKNRINYIDNIRSLVILLLFPFHTFRMFTHFEPFYVQGEPQAFCDVFIAATSIWFMNILFVLAGISISFSLKKRTIKEFLLERITKLLIPFIFGVLLTIPIQTYYAEKFHNNYQGGYMEQLRLYFTKETDLSGYFGGFTPAHLWFLLFLFLISILSLPVIIYVKKNGLPQLKKSPSLIRIIPWFLVIMLSSVVELGESLGQYMAYFLLGYLLLQREEVLLLLKRYKWRLTGIAVLLSTTSVVTYLTLDWSKVNEAVEMGVSALRHLSSWMIILTLLGLSQCYLNFRNRITTYINKNSFSIYFVHQTILIVIGYYTVRVISTTVVQMFVIMFGTFSSSILACEVLKRIPVVRTMFGMENK